MRKITKECREVTHFRTMTYLSTSKWLMTKMIWMEMMMKKLMMMRMETWELILINNWFMNKINKTSKAMTLTINSTNRSIKREDNRISKS